MSMHSQRAKELDFSLIRKAAKGNEKAFSELIDFHKVKLRQSIFHFGASQEECEEIYQKTLIKIWRNLKNFRFQSSFYTWYYRISYNLFIDEKRKTTKNKVISLDSVSLNRSRSQERALDILLGGAIPDDSEKYKSPLEKLDDKEKEEEEKRVVNFIFEKLSPKHKEVLKMFEIEDLSYSDISKRINCSVGTVMSRLFYARENAKKIIRRYKTR